MTEYHKQLLKRGTVLNPLEKKNVNEEKKESETGFSLVPEDDINLVTVISEEEEISEDVLADASRLATFLTEQDNGYGIAANQVGLQRRVFILRNTESRLGDPVVCINPVITRAYGDKMRYDNFPKSRDRIALQFGEGCLSFPGKLTRIKRYEQIAVKYTNLEGVEVTEKIRGFRAVAFQHELDHLNGIVCITHPDQWRPIWTPS